MELLYVYAEEYRLFHKQEFHFSDRFHVHYDPDRNRLDIRRNEDYFDLFPGNIKGVTAIVGRNASGKTSLLSLIGDRSEQRKKEAGSYLLVYYYGREDQKSDGQEVFFLESNFPDTYFSGISGYEVRSRQKHVDSKEVCCLLAVSAPHPEQTGPLAVRARPELNSLAEMEYAMTSFRSGGLSSQDQVMENERRRYAKLQTDSIYDEARILAEGMRSHQKDHSLYHRKSYRLEIRYTPAATVESYVLRRNQEDYQCLSEYDEVILRSIRTAGGRVSGEVLIMSLLLSQVRWQLGRLEYLMVDNAKVRQAFGPALRPAWTSRSNSDKLMETYESLLQLERNSVPRMALIPRLDHEQLLALRNFLNGPSVTIFWDPSGRDCCIRWRITAETLADRGDGAYEGDLLKRQMDDLQALPIFRGALQWRIRELSRGERENLSMFTAINEQIELQSWCRRRFPSSESGAYVSLDYSWKKKFILLFDEIERSMHPNMCRRLLTDLMNFLDRYPDKEFQLIIATHSPFILGDLRKENVVCLGENGQVVPREDQPESFGQNIHTLLKSQFFLDNTFSQYAVDLINTVSGCLREKQDLKEIGDTIRETLHSEDPEKSVPETDEQVRRFLDSFIASVGEPLLHRALEADWRDWQRHHNGPEETPEAENLQLKAENQRLKQELRRLRGE